MVFVRKVVSDREVLRFRRQSDGFTGVWNILRVNLLIGICVFAWALRIIDAQSAESTHKLHGVVRNINLEEATVVIKHGPIPDFMPMPMTMEYHVETAAELKGLKAGATVEGSVFERDGQYWIAHLKVTKGD